jgi:hypothetical protein
VLPALGDALLNMPVGEIEAAIQGRRRLAPTNARPWAILAGRDDPNFERNLKADLANAAR